MEDKQAVVKTLISGSEYFPSNLDLRALEVQTVVGSLLRRGYSQGFIENTRKQMRHGRTKATNNYKAGVVTIPYVKGVSESIRRSLLPLGIRTTFKPHIKLRDLISKPKDPTPPESQSGVVYKVNCQDCDKCYIGETGRKRSTRLKEHRRDVEKATHATRSKTELVEHCWTTGHTFDLANAVTLAREQRWGPRRFLESWCIRSDPSACNTNRGPLPDV